ncbi:superoxide dismutase [Fe] [Candidatus Saganbacteria bacterium]|nr:superoxide dismutase [Fe] [Candidatus Saganbacteria bacterium]
MEHKLPDLPFAKDALAPLISQETIDFHYGKHHAAYVANLNKLISGTEFAPLTLEEIIKKAAGGIYNNAAQIWNHTFYWNCLSAKGGGEPTGRLADEIKKNFGSLAQFKEKFTSVATTFFGSGWTWLIKNNDGTLVVEGMNNAGNPLKDGRQAILTCDVWEHAYYIDYRNARAAYVEAFWKLVNWKFAEINL